MRVLYVRPLYVSVLCSCGVRVTYMSCVGDAV